MRCALAMRVLTAALLCGCAPRGATVPAIKWQTHGEAREVLIRRADAVQTVTAQGTIMLTRGQNTSVRFDLAMVQDREGGVRLRAWKLGRAVFDLTMTPDGVWLLTPEDPSLKEKVRPAGVSARQLVEAWQTFSGDFFRRQSGNFQDHQTSLIYHDGNIECLIDRSTLTPETYTLRDAQGCQRFRLELFDYRQIDGLPFAHRYIARSEDGEIVVVLRDVELNTPLALGALRPPRRAEKLP